MLQEIATIIIIISALFYTVMKTVRLFQKQKKGKMKKGCAATCNSCAQKRAFDLS